MARPSLKPVKSNAELLQDKKDTALSVVESLRKRFSDNVVFFGDDDKLNADIPVLSTGSIGLDIATGVGGVPQSRIIEIYGPESSGKTTVSLSIIAQAQKQGVLCAYIDMEHALDLKWAKMLGVDPTRIIISQPDTGDDAMEICEEIIQSNAVGLVVVDSVAALVPRAEMEGDMSDSHVGLQARLMARALRKLTSKLSTTKTTLIFTNQLRDKIGGFGFAGSPETTTGGRALKFYASIRIDVRRIEQIKHKEQVIGARTRAKITKNKVASPFREAEFEIMFDEGISNTGEIIDLGTEAGIILKNGAFFKYNGNNFAQGRENARKYLMENPQFAFEIHNKILTSKGLPELTTMPEYNKLSLAKEIKIQPLQEEPKRMMKIVEETKRVSIADIESISEGSEEEFLQEELAEESEE